jgi:hypothetical protein
MRRPLLVTAPLAGALVIGCGDTAPPSGLSGAPNLIEAPSAARETSQASIRATIEGVNRRLASLGMGIRIGKAEWITRAESGQVGQTVFFNDRGDKRLSFDFVPGDMRRGGRTNILYLVDQSDGAAVGGLSSAQTEAAIDRAVESWNDVACSTIPIEKAPDTGADPDIVDFFAGVGDLGLLNLGPVVAVDVVHAGFLGAAFFDAFTPGCVPGSGDNPCGSEFVFGITLTDGFVDADGNFTDVNHDGRLDAAFREIYYNNSEPDANGVTVPWRIDAYPDVESVALHEFGHGLSQGHFGKAFITQENGKIHFSPFAVMNSAHTRVSQDLVGTDLGGHCAIWGSWATN